MKMMMPVIRRYAIAAVTYATVTNAAAVKDRRGAKTAAVDGNTAASKSAAVKCRPTAAEAATAMKTSATAKASSSSATVMSAAGLDRHCVGRIFRRWRRAGTGE